MDKYKNIKTYKIVLHILLLISFLSCQSKHHYIPNNVESVAISIERFDSAQLSINPDSTYLGICQLYNQYPEFMPLFVERVLGLPAEDTILFSKLYADFITDTVMGFAQTNQFAKLRFAQIDSLENSIQTAFSRLHYLYPEWEIPSIYLFVSGFNSSIMYCSNIIGVGIDMYLGSNYPYYNQVAYEYQKQQMHKENIPIDVLKSHIAYQIGYNSQKNRLLDHMIFRGKQLFLLAQLFPDNSSREIIGYTQDQWNWCKKYEQAIWTRIMEKRDLFKSEPNILSSYLNDGPFTAEITQDSPGRLGQWVGWQIVDSYMRNNTTVTIQELMQEKNAQKILELSYYKP